MLQVHVQRTLVSALTSQDDTEVAFSQEHFLGYFTPDSAFHFQRSLPLSGHHCRCLLSSMPVIQANLSILQIQACQTPYKGFHVAHQIKSRSLNLSLHDLTSDYPFSLMAHHYFITPPMLLLQRMMHRVLNVNLSDWVCTHATPFLASFLLPCCTH